MQNLIFKSQSTILAEDTGHQAGLVPCHIHTLHCVFGLLQLGSAHLPLSLDCTGVLHIPNMGHMQIIRQTICISWLINISRKGPETVVGLMSTCWETIYMSEHWQTFLQSSKTLQLFLTRFYLGLCTLLSGRKSITQSTQGKLHELVSGPEAGSWLILFTSKDITKQFNIQRDWAVTCYMQRTGEFDMQTMPKTLTTARSQSERWFQLVICGPC